jgi:hypothetical protein
MFLEIEAVLVLVAVAMAFTVPELGSHWFEAFERTFGNLAERRGLSVVVVGLAALVLRAALLPILPIPQPGGMDGFCYLLLSDTFAHGRVTNPTSPMWVHFESFYVIWQPTHTAMFYPAQGLIMAVGQVLMGHPFWGVWLSVGLMCAAITWMLQGWLTPGWALLGGFLAVIRLGTFSYWADSYWGGAVAALGGALVLGALPRIKQGQRVRHALLMGLGFAIIGNSRPYEGLFFGVPVVAALLVWLWKMKRPEVGRALKRTLAPLLTVIALTLVAMGYYFWRTTGSPFNTPYLVYTHAYNPVPYFPWQSLRPEPVYHHPRIRETYYKKVLLPMYESPQTVRGIFSDEGVKCLYLGSFFLGFVFTLPLLLACTWLPYGFKWRDISPGTRFLLLTCGITLAGEALPTWFFPHYAAPLTCAILALVLIAMRRLRSWCWRNKSVGLFVTRAVPSMCVLLFALRIGAGITGWPPVSIWPAKSFIPTWCALSSQNMGRAATLAKLRRYPGRQLVIVHYGPDHDVSFHEWVYNRADLKTAKVIWARDMGPAKNEELITYFKDRHAWLVDADDNPPKLLPYSEAADSEPATAPQTQR